MTQLLLAPLLVALGGAIGALLRHLVAGVIGIRLGHGAFGTLAVNVSGGLAIGLAAGLMLGSDGPPDPSGPWLLLVVGIIGSYTTVSSFSLQTLTLFEENRIGAALGNIAASLVLSLIATGLGLALAGGL